MIERFCTMEITGVRSRVRCSVATRCERPVPFDRRVKEDLWKNCLVCSNVLRNEKRRTARELWISSIETSFFFPLEKAVFFLEGKFRIGWCIENNMKDKRRERDQYNNLVTAEYCRGATGCSSFCASRKLQAASRGLTVSSFISEESRGGIVRQFFFELFCRFSIHGGWLCRFLNDLTNAVDAQCKFDKRV